MRSHAFVDVDRSQLGMSRELRADQSPPLLDRSQCPRAGLLAYPYVDHLVEARGGPLELFEVRALEAGGAPFELEVRGVLARKLPARPDVPGSPASEAEQPTG